VLCLWLRLRLGGEKKKSDCLIWFATRLDTPLTASNQSSKPPPQQLQQQQPRAYILKMVISLLKNTASTATLAAGLPPRRVVATSAASCRCSARADRTMPPSVRALVAPPATSSTCAWVSVFGFGHQGTAMVLRRVVTPDHTTAPLSHAALWVGTRARWDAALESKPEWAQLQACSVR